MGNYAISLIGEYLKNLRETKGFKITDVAKFVGVSHAHISMIECGKRLPSPKLLFKFASLYEVPLLELLSLLSIDLEEEKKEGEDFNEEIAKIRLANLYPLQFSPFDSLSFYEMLEILKRNYPEGVKSLYEKAVKNFPELKGKEEIEIIKNYLAKSLSIKESIYLNKLSKLIPQKATYSEVILEIKKSFSWTWKRIAGEFGVNERTVIRWTKGETKIPEKVKRKIEFLYYVVLKRTKEFVEPLIHLYEGPSHLEANFIFEALEKVGLSKEIKKRFIQKYPEMEKFKSKSLPEFFFYLSKKFSPIKEKIKVLSQRRGIGNHKLSNLKKSKLKKKSEPVIRKKEDKIEEKQKGKIQIGDDEGDDDSWLLKNHLKNIKIKKVVELLFENLLLEIQAAGVERSLQKEVPMTLYRRKNSPYFYVDICINGIRIRRSTKCTSKREAEKIKSLLLMKFLFQQSFEFPEKMPTFQEISEKFIIYQRNSNKVSWKREEICHRTVLPYLGKFRINQISSKKIQEIIEKIKEKKVRGNKIISPRSVEYIRGFLHRVFEYAKNIEGIIKENPVAKIPPIKYVNKRERVINFEEEKRLLKAIDDEVFLDAVIFTFLTGLREGEILNLKKKDFNRMNDILYFKILREKNKEWTQYPVVWDEAKRIIEKYLKIAPEKEEFFCYPTGEVLTRWKLIENLKKAMKKAEIQNLCFNDFRRTFYTRMELAGCNYLILEYLMGHKLPKISSHYFGLTLKDIADHLEKIKEKIVTLLAH